MLEFLHAEKSLPAQKIKKAKKAWFPRKDANFWWEKSSSQKKG